MAGIKINRVRGLYLRRLFALLGTLTLFHFETLAQPVGAKREAPTKVIYLHGLWGNKSQFEDVEAALSKRYPSLKHERINLPGHSEDYTTNFDKSVRYQDWVKATKDLLDQAHAKGEKVLLVGQSTGALLALTQGLEKHPALNSMALFEPSLDIHPHFKALACHSPIVNVHTAAPVVEWLKLKVDRPIYVRYGCELNKLIHETFPQKRQAFMRQNRMRFRDSPLNEQRVLDTARQLEIPVLVVNNAKDALVDPVRTRLFGSALDADRSRYVEFNQSGERRHGLFNVQNNDVFLPELEKLLDDLGAQPAEEKPKPGASAPNGRSSAPISPSSSTSSSTTK